jgi:hypothetical protein
MNRLRPVCALVAGLLSLLAAARSESLPPSPDVAQSVSGQFSVSFEPDHNPYFRLLNAGTNTDLLRLEPALLAVSAERFKAALGREIGLAANTPWSGKIFLALHPARSLDEPVNLVAQPFLHNWNYRLELPDLVTRNRCARAFSAVMLLEIANRSAPAGGHSAALPEWLVSGLARQILAAEDAAVILAAPGKLIDDLAQTRVNEQRRGIDPLAAARRVLQNFPALTFEQLSWPTAAQVNGDDGGGYQASAQLFVSELLALKDGPAKVRALLAQLPAHENWQAAFLAAFPENFQRPLDVEKWWSLRVVAFATRAPGPLWITAVSRGKLDAALAVPVNIRYSPNALPSYAEISLQSVIRNFETERQVQILQTRLRDLELIQVRLTPSLAGLADAYCKVLSDYLHARKKFYFLRRPGPAKTISRLDALDARRREVESKLRTSVLPPDLNLPAP